MSDIATRKGVVPALRYDNGNPKGRNYIRFDGIEKGADGSSTLLIDAKKQLPLWSEGAKRDLLDSLDRVKTAVEQNPGYKVMYEFPNEKAAQAAKEFLTVNKLDKVVSVRVRGG
ncbi:MAG: hypothetical protein RMZ43_036030 [Nostoc sp. CmiVER01]|uniref:hypothetical protein n=1 Tax=Nostoc sp. CmiVER01 TaxID=3075384 RepID=UPI003D1608D9